MVITVVMMVRIWAARLIWVMLVPVFPVIVAMVVFVRVALVYGTLLNDDGALFNDHRARLDIDRSRFDIGRLAKADIDIDFGLCSGRRRKK